MSQIVLVTGASSGFGRLTVERLARAGHVVWAGMRDVTTRNAGVAAELAALAAQADLKLRTVELDVTSTDSVNAAVEQVRKTDGRVDVVFNNAGRMFTGLAESFSVEQLQLQLETNLVGAFRVVKAVLPIMREQGAGLLIHTSSVFGRLANPFVGLYNSSKFGLEGLVHALAYETHLLGIDNVLLEAGPFRTNIATGGEPPVDAAVAARYGAVGETLGGWFQGMGAFMAQENPLLDPNLVAQAVEELIAMPAGTRPLRRPVGIDYGVGQLNEAAAPFERGIVDTQQLGFLTGPRRSS